ncbi:MAG: PD-(D/E)XK nuclease family protein [Candidatus Giovannonibacteria bacterium]|nr:MAG: PD-(D/E)XK nuclease family protein [Candidatus Giovannonibacteria bacterium]
MRTSYSALATYQQCPQKFKFEVIDKIKAPKSPEALFGSSMHGALKFMFSRDPLFPTLDEVLINFSENWKNAAAKASKSLASELAKIYDESGRKMLKEFFKSNPPWNFSVVDTESRFEVLLSDTQTQETHILAGIIDRIDKIGDGEYEIIDYKTNRKLPSQEAADRNLQMSLYHMALTRRWPSISPDKIKLSLYFLKHDEKISSKRSAENLKTTRDSVLKTIRQISQSQAQDNFPTIVSKLCDWCPYKPICPAWRHLYEKTEYPAPDEAALQSALREYFTIKETDNKNAARVKELQEIIKTYMDAQKIDRVFDERGYYISKKLQQRFKYDFDKVKEILTAAGLESAWQSILEADDKKLKIILKTLSPALRAQIESQKILAKEFIVLTPSSKPAKK